MMVAHEDALTSGTLDGGGSDKPGSRLNLHDDLWTQGSLRGADGPGAPVMVRSEAAK